MLLLLLPSAPRRSSPCTRAVLLLCDPIADDNCDLSATSDFLESVNKSWYWFDRAKRVELATNGASAPLTEAYEAYLRTTPRGRALAEATGSNKTGGFPWSCGGESLTPQYLSRPDVEKALHLRPKGASAFHYTHDGGLPSYSVWPFLASKLHVLIYTGDSEYPSEAPNPGWPFHVPACLAQTSVRIPVGTARACRTRGLRRGSPRWRPTV